MSEEIQQPEFGSPRKQKEDSPKPKREEKSKEKRGRRSTLMTAIRWFLAGGFIISGAQAGNKVVEAISKGLNPENAVVGQGQEILGDLNELVETIASTSANPELSGGFSEENVLKMTNSIQDYLELKLSLFYLKSPQTDLSSPQQILYTLITLHNDSIDPNFSPLSFQFTGEAQTALEELWQELGLTDAGVITDYFTFSKELSTEELEIIFNSVDTTALIAQIETQLPLLEQQVNTQYAEMLDAIPNLDQLRLDQSLVKAKLAELSYLRFKYGSVELDNIGTDLENLYESLIFYVPPEADASLEQISDYFLRASVPDLAVRFNVEATDGRGQYTWALDRLEDIEKLLNQLDALKTLPQDILALIGSILGLFLILNAQLYKVLQIGRFSNRRERRAYESTLNRILRRTRRKGFLVGAKQSTVSQPEVLQPFESTDREVKLAEREKRLRDLLPEKEEETELADSQSQAQSG